MAMFTLPGYEIDAPIDESVNAFVYRGYRRRDDRPVIIKILKPDYTTPIEADRVTEETAIAPRLDVQGIVKVYGIERYQSTVVLVLEDFGGQPLKTITETRSLSLQDILSLAVQIAEILDSLHASNFVHQRINPSNVIFNPETGQIKLIDLCLSAGISCGISNLETLLEPSLAYISPEQTGRTNRDLDYRTDFYSLGAMLYELLAGKLPFDTTDPMELVHCHLAREPVPPSQIVAEVPKAVSDIVMKLMAKPPEDRYQSAWGLQADLVLCLMQLEATGEIEDLIPGEDDVTQQLQIPQKLYGRDREFAALISAFEERRSPQGDSTDRGPTVWLVSGDAGVGKSTLVEKLNKPVARQRGYFISASVANRDNDDPYGPWVDAARQLVRQLLTETEERLQVWKETLTAATEDGGAAIVAAIPELAPILNGPFSAPEPSLTRFETAFRALLRAFWTRPEPVVLFLDDLQAAREETLKLLEAIVIGDRPPNLLAIGAYRHREVDRDRALAATIDRLQGAGVSLHRLHLRPLEMEAVTALVAETVRQDERTARPLAETIWHKTDGNPFYARELLARAYTEGWLGFDSESMSWQWNIEAIAAEDLAENVVEARLAAFADLPKSVRSLLCQAACVGERFDLATLAAVRDAETAIVTADLAPAVAAGLVRSLSESEYAFAHPQFQEAALARVEDRDRSALHLKLARLLLDRDLDSIPASELFAVADRCNTIAREIAVADRKAKLARLNWVAGREAMQMGKYAAARKYLLSGIDSLNCDRWEDHYDLTLALYRAQAENECLCGNFERSRSSIELLFDMARSDEEKAAACILAVRRETLQGQHEAAIEVGVSGLKLLGVELPRSPERDRTIEQLSHLEKELETPLPTPKTKEISPAIALELQLYDCLALSASIVDGDWFATLVMRWLQVARESEYLPALAMVYGLYGSLRQTYLNDAHGGFYWGELAVQIGQTLGRDRQAIALAILGTQLWERDRPLPEALPILEAADRAARESGQFYLSATILANKTLLQFYAGKNLEQIIVDLPRYLKLCQQACNHRAINSLLGCQLPLLNLCGQTGNVKTFASEEIDESRYVKTCNRWGDESSLRAYYAHKSFVLYLYEEYGDALAAARKMDAIGATACDRFKREDEIVYLGLALAANYSKAAKATQKKYDRQLEAIGDRLRYLAADCPFNFGHQLHLLQGELARLQGRYLEAIDEYDRAIATAAENGFLQWEAIANERAAKLWLAKGKQKLAKVYINDAHRTYRAWGATRKVEQLESKYPYLLAPAPAVRHAIPPSNNPTDVPLATSYPAIGELDLATVMKAAQTLSGEIVLGQLLDKLMQMAIANAGATTGFLILERAGKLAIEAAGSVGKKATIDLRSIPIENSDRLPQAIVNYVVRTQESVVLADAATDATFANDPYIKQHLPKSVLCAPILGQGKLIGITYLENNLTSGAFTRDRIEVLKLLCSQAAISLENAKLYEELQDSERREREKAQQLERSLRELEEAQIRLIQGEKMATLGQLVAGVAHEINNPVGFIVGNLTLAENYAKDLIEHLKLYQEQFPDPGETIEEDAEDIDLEYLFEDMPKLLSSMKLGTDRIRQISTSLRTFSRSDTDAKVSVNLHEGIDSTLLILKHRLKANENRPSIQIQKEYGELPTVKCYAGQLNQVFMNIISNAADAFDETNEGRSFKDIEQDPNIIFIRTEANAENNTAIVRIGDNGPGMSEEVRQKVFNHLFTTKGVGKGTGLGLSISRQIVVEKHGGQLTCNSSPGNGTEFVIEIPIFDRNDDEQ